MKKRSKIQDYAEYLALKAIMFFIYLFPLKAAQIVGEFGAVFAYYVIPFRKKHVIEMLTLSFPEKTPSQIRIIAKNVYKNFFKTMIEIMFFPKTDSQAIKNMMTIENEHLIEQAHKGAKGAILMSAHFGNWELTALSFSQRYPMSVVVAKQSNGLIDAMMDKIRTTRGFNTICRDNMAYKGVLKALKRNEFVAVLSDQDGGRQGVFVEFFGRPASVPKGAALFALRAGCPIITAFGVRQPDATIKVYLDEIPLPNTGDPEKDVEIICVEYSKKLEQAVRLHPEHWFWFHRKWKTRPK
ncbi:MAG: lysophospholipid acyltransferase family protein [Endomicrobium sp.]|jgi:KDO2-lipid IV(A) lauroyltransferase|nr:lysophospholipid acyltransferase family protein [Endomicrobium sp.]